MPAVMPPPAPVVAPEAAVTSPQSVVMDDHAKQQLAESFAAQSGMNVCWARKYVLRFLQSSVVEVYVGT
jgi:hypothetical protein